MNKKVKVDKWPQEVAVQVRALSHDGRGIATLDNKITFINGALPDEEVICKITHQHRSYSEANLLRIIKASSQREKPSCQYFNVCGGCSLQHMSMSTQLELKEQMLLNQLKHFGQVKPQHILPVLTAETLGYRRKARIGVKYVIKKNKLFVGFREKKSNYLTDLDKCVILHPKVGDNLKTLNELITNLAIARHIPQIEVALGDTEAALVFRHLAPFPSSDLQKLIDFAQKEQFEIYLQPNPPVLTHKLWPKNTPTERLTYSLPDADIEFLFHPLDFTQINLSMNRLMVKQAIDLMEFSHDDIVLDLFCGIGNFTLPIAKKVHHITGIEGSAEMVARAFQNAKHNRIQNTNFYEADLMKTLANATWLNIKYDKVLLDPPRAGAKDILPHLNFISPKKICYISCNPATLARDAGELVNQYGYHLEYIGLINMFPHTAHIEAMAIFNKN